MKQVAVKHEDDAGDKMALLWYYWQTEAISRGVSDTAIENIFEQWFEDSIRLLIPEPVFREWEKIQND